MDCLNIISGKLLRYEASLIVVIAATVWIVAGATSRRVVASVGNFGG